jgi:uncharacterized protein YbjQ (UPF0145 family)
MNPFVQYYFQHLEFFSTVLLLVVGYGVGTLLEMIHVRSIKERERFFHRIPAVTMKLEHFLPPAQWHNVDAAELVVGSIVIAPDYFRFVMGMIMDIVGGKVFTYESVLDRARREALLRMKESAPMADLVVNTRLEMVEMQSVIQQLPIKPLCLYAYGTAIRLKTKTSDVHHTVMEQARSLEGTPPIEHIERT